MTPFILAGAMAPGHGRRRVCPDAGRGARRDDVRASWSGRAPRSSWARSPARCRCSPARRRSARPNRPSSCTRWPALARRLGVPFRSGGSLCASKIADAQAAYESAATLQPTILAGVNFVLHAAGWLEGGLTIGYEKFILDADQCGMMAGLRQGHRPVRERPGPRRHPGQRAGHAFPGQRPHPGQLRDAPSTAPSIADNNSFEKWQEDGSLDAAQRANAIWKRMLADYQAPADRSRPSTRRSSSSSRASKASMPDAFV